MAIISIHAPAKVNIALGILGQQDGYHVLDSYIDFTKFGDNIFLQKTNEGHHHIVTIDGEFAPLLRDTMHDNNNVILQSLTWLSMHGYIDCHYKVRLQKNIPVGAGLGGGSADAAAILRYFTQHDPQFLTQYKHELFAMGADIPVCYANSPSHMRSRGEHAKPWQNPYSYIVLASPLEYIETADIFRQLPSSMWHGDIIYDNDELLLRNDLTDIASLICPAINHILMVMSEQQECLYAGMSGSGSTCFALSNNQNNAYNMCHRLVQHNYWVRATSFASISA